MSIRAILQHGVIQPIEPLPSTWIEGQELLIEEPIATTSNEELRQWADDLEVSSARIPSDEHERFLQALEGIERESKEAVRKQWSQP